MSYSGLSLLTHALTGNKHWPSIIDVQEMRSSYDIVIIGGVPWFGHGPLFG